MNDNDNTRHLIPCDCCGWQVYTDCIDNEERTPTGWICDDCAMGKEHCSQFVNPDGTPNGREAAKHHLKGYMESGWTPEALADSNGTGSQVLYNYAINEPTTRKGKIAITKVHHIECFQHFPILQLCEEVLAEQRTGLTQKPLL